jgi:hypothetical protein
MKQFTEQEVKDAEFAIMAGIAIRQEARVMERKRDLSDAEILARVSEQDKERFQRGKLLYQAGAYRP